MNIYAALPIIDNASLGDIFAALQRNRQPRRHIWLTAQSRHSGGSYATRLVATLIFDPNIFKLLTNREVKGKEDVMEAVIVGLVAIAVIWLVVIYGSIYMNKNVQ